ncbi:MAG: hypothetical protein KBE65_12485 [Phycisphaerae bacterium]|nr:hypothetical protein [Phycisphaerae bacterium]
MSGRYATWGTSTRWGIAYLRFLLPCVLAVSLVGCQGEASKKEPAAVQPGQEAVQAEPVPQGREAKITLENPVVELGEVGTSKTLSGKFTFVSSGKARLKIKASVVQRAEVIPERLRLFLRQENAAAAAQQAAASALVSDVLEVRTKDEETLSVPFRGFYAAEQSHRGHPGRRGAACL